MDKEVKKSNLYKCINCNHAEGMKQDDFMKHLESVHSIDTEKTEGIRTMLLHADSSTYYKYVFEWNIKGVIFTQEIINPRDEDSPMRY